MSKTPNYDAKIKTILDGLVPGERVCSVTGEKWFEGEKEINWYKKFNIPPLPMSPQAFLTHLSLFLTGFSWWWNKHAETGKPLITATHPHTKYKVILDDEWHQKDFSEINQEIKTDGSFLNQIVNLAFSVPLSAHRNFERPVNSIARHSFGDENSYFVEGTISKNALYSADTLHVEDSAEVQWSGQVRDSYNVVQSHDIFHCRVARSSKNCHHCDFIFDCWDCEDCFMSWNQRHKKFLFRNQQLTEGEWRQKMAEIDFGSFKVFDSLYREFKNNVDQVAVWPENFNERAENSSGEYLQNCLNVERGWYCDGAKNSSWMLWGNMGTDNCFLGCDPGGTNCCGNMITTNCSDCFFNWVITRCLACEYCVECLECQNCFGCVGLKHKKFHILNKEYSEEEYWKKVDEIKTKMLELGEYGRPFPLSMMQTPLRHSGGAVCFEVSDELAGRLGALDYDPSLDGAYGDWQGKQLHSVSEIPESISAADESCLGMGFLDVDLNRPFSIHPEELKLCKRLNVPLRQEHFIKRVEDQWKEINKFVSEPKTCRACGQNVQTAANSSYPNRVIYCRPCYLKYLEENN